MIYAVLLSLIVFLGVTSVSDAITLGRCGLHDQLVKDFEREYKERVVANGLSSNGTIIELMLAPFGLLHHSQN